MANTFITPSVIAARGLATLYNSIVLAALMSRDYDADFRGKVGDTITIRKPATFTADLFDTTARTTDWQDVVEDSTTLVLDKLPHVPVLVTDEQMTLEIEDFQTQILNPMMEALAQYLDVGLAEALVDAANGSGGGGVVSVGSEQPNYVFRKAREVLQRNNLPMGDRYAVLSPEAETEALGDSLLVKVNESGSTLALREAILGRIVGFTTFGTQTFGAGANDAGSADGVAFHKSAVVLAMRPLNQPRGIPSSQYSVQDYKGLSLRVVYSYDHGAKSDKVTVDTLYGIKATRPEGVVELDFGQGS